MTIPSYFITGSVAGPVGIRMNSGVEAEVIGVRLTLNPMDIDDDNVIVLLGVLGREDADTLVDSIVMAAAEVPYLSDQIKEENDGDSESQPADR